MTATANMAMALLLVAATNEEPPLVPPVLFEHVEAAYPEAALLERVEAVVVLEIDVDAAGEVEAVQVVECTEARHGFEEAAMVAASQFRFEPGRVGDEPVPVRITYRYGFALGPPEVETLADDGPAEKARAAPTTPRP